jgi:hypothetical protein
MAKINGVYDQNRSKKGMIGFNNLTKRHENRAFKIQSNLWLITLDFGGGCFDKQLL